MAFHFDFAIFFSLWGCSSSNDNYNNLNCMIWQLAAQKNKYVQIASTFPTQNNHSRHWSAYIHMHRIYV